LNNKTITLIIKLIASLSNSLYIGLLKKRGCTV